MHDIEMIEGEKFGSKINAPPSFLQRDLGTLVVNFGGSTCCIFAPCLFIFFFLTLAKFTIRACKAYAIMREFNALAFCIGLRLKLSFENKVYNAYLFCDVNKFHFRNDKYAVYL